MKKEINISQEILTSKQKEIHTRLKEIGEEIAAFYLDGIIILNDDSIQTKSNLLAHVAREIDGGFRDIFFVNEPLKICELCKKPINTHLHQKSICKVLGVDKENPLAKEWFLTSKDFHKFAHRHGAYKKPRPLDDFQDIWSRYEDVLFRLIGSYYRLLDRIDDILKKEKPSKAMIKTLPNLLKIKSREHYFFTKLDKIGWLKPLKDAGFFDPSNNPQPIQSPGMNGYFLPYWAALNYIERITSKAQRKDTDLIIDIIRSIIEYKIEGDRVINSRTDYQIFKIICSLPSERITKEHIDFIAETLVSDFYNSLISADIGKTLIPKLIAEENKDRLLEVFEVLTRFKYNENTLTENAVPIIEEYWFADILDKNNQEISAFCGLDVVKLLISRIKDITKEDKHSFNIVWIPTIEDHKQHSFTRRYEAVIVRFLRNSLLNLEITELKPIVKELLEDDLSILKRLAFFMINQKYSDLHELFWAIQDNPFEHFDYKHELYELCKSHAQDFSTGEITKFIGWIEALKLPNSKEKEEVRTAYLKKEWYSALLDSGNKKVLDKYKKYDKLNPMPIEHAGFVTWSETSCGEISPLQEVELNRMTSKVIVEYLISFKEQGGFRNPTAMGLAETLTKTVKLNPNKFSEELKEYKDIPMIYRHALLDGFSQAWRDNKQFNWEEVLEYIQHTLKEEIKQQGKEGFDYYEWFIAQACRIIEDGTQSDDHAFDKQLLPLAKEILLLISKKITKEECNNENYARFLLNSTKGKMLEAMLNYSLRLTRVEKKKEWDKDIQSIFHTELKGNPSIELHTLIGKYIQNFLYLDEKWIKDNVLLIFPKGKPKHFQAALDGYFFDLPAYHNLYQMLKNEGIFSVVLERWDENLKRIKDKVIAHICIAYAEGWELIDDEDSLIDTILKKNETHDKIIHFFNANSKNLKSEYKSKVKSLWKILFDINKGSNNAIVGKLTDWLVIFDELDEELYLWSKEGASHIKPYWETHGFIKNLAKFAEKEPQKTGELFWALIKDTEHVPDYKKEDIINIIKTLYQKGEKEMANRICNKFGEKGNDFLRETYELNNTI
jgi:hypothetical protein